MMMMKKQHHLGGVGIATALLLLSLIDGVSASLSAAVVASSTSRSRTLRGGVSTSTKTGKVARQHFSSNGDSNGSYDGGYLYYSGDEPEQVEEQMIAAVDGTNNSVCDNMSPTQRISALRQIVLTITPEEILNNVQSPQAKAFHWLIYEDRIDPPICPPATVASGSTTDVVSATAAAATLLERYIMTSFYYATNGDNWKECNAPVTSTTTNDDEKKCTRTITVQSSEVLSFIMEQAFGDTSTATTTTAEAQDHQQQHHDRKIGTKSWLSPFDTCEWGGLACSYYYNESNDGTGYYSIDQIEFEDNNLSGTLIPELSSLSQLRFLILEKGQLYGSIPKEYGSNLTNLRVLDMDYNKLSGPIPNEVYDLVELRELDLNDNRLNGEISSRIGMLRNLRYLQLDNNEFVGSVPEEVGELKELGE